MQKLYNSRHWTGIHVNGANEDLQLNSLVLPNSIAIGSEDNAQRKLIVDVTDEDIDQNVVQEYASISSTVDSSSSDIVGTADENIIKYEQQTVKGGDSNSLESDISRSLQSVDIQDETDCVKHDYEFIKAQCDMQVSVAYVGGLINLSGFANKLLYYV